MNARNYVTADQLQAEASRATGMFSLESETAVVAAMLAAPDACQDYADRLTADQFGEPVLGRLWRLGMVFLRDGRSMAPALLRDALGVDEGFTAWGGIDRLFDLQETGTIKGLGDHVEAICDRAQRRAIRQLADDIAARATDTAGGPAVDILGELERGAAEIANQTATAEHWVAAGDMVRAAIERSQSRSTAIEFPTGLTDVDKAIGGFNAGEVSLLGARTGMGKTIGGLQSAKASAATGLGTIFFSLEMAAEPMGIRLACDVAFDRLAPVYSGETSNPTIDKALKNQLQPHQWERLARANEIIDRLPLLIDTRPGLTMVQIEAAARRAHRAWARQGIKPGPIFIDHIGKVRPSKDRRGNQTAEVGDASNYCLEMAKRLGVPVVPLVQLNRQVEGRGDDKRPLLTDLRQSGELEQDARQVIFLYRPEYYLRPPLGDEDFDQKNEREGKLAKVRNQLFWIVEKNSNGPRAQVKTFCEAACSAVRDWDPGFLGGLC